MLPSNVQCAVPPGTFVKVAPRCNRLLRFAGVLSTPTAVPVAPCALHLHLQLAEKRLVVQEPGQLVVVGPVRELRGRAVEVGDYALGHEPVDGVVEAPLDEQDVIGVEVRRARRDEPPEHPSQKQELGDDLARREAEGLPLARVVAGLRGERAADSEAFGLRLQQLAAELRDEGRHVAQLAEAAESLERRQLVIEQPFLDHVHGKLPRAALDGRCELFER